MMDVRASKIAGLRNRENHGVFPRRSSGKIFELKTEDAV